MRLVSVRMRSCQIRAGSEANDGCLGEKRRHILTQTGTTGGVDLLGNEELCFSYGKF